MKYEKIAILVLLAFALLVLTGCSTSPSESTTVSDVKVRQTSLDLTQCSKGSKKNSSASSSGTSSTENSSDSANDKKTGEAKTVDIPDEYDDLQQNYGIGSNLQCLIDGVTTSAGWVEWGKEGNGGNAGMMARKWRDGGKEYVGGVIPAVDGRALVTVKGTYGQAGDYIDINYKDGHVLHAIIFDIQGANDDGDGPKPYHDYGHATGGICNVLEWYSDPGWDDKYKFLSNGAAPCAIDGFEYVTGIVDSITNTGGVNTGTADDGKNTPTDDTCADDSKDTAENVAVGEAAKVDESTTARLNFLYGDAGVPQTESANKGYLETFDVVVRKPDGTKGTWTLTMHKKIKTEVQAIFQDIYKNTDYTIDPADGNSLRAWNNEAGKYMAPQTNSNHAYGLAIDINVKSNNGTGSCNVGTTYNPGSDPLSITADSDVYKIFKKHGFFWGGDWTTPKDYMHFAYTDH